MPFRNRWACAPLIAALFVSNLKRSPEYASDLKPLPRNLAIVPHQELGKDVSRVFSQPRKPRVLHAAFGAQHFRRGRLTALIFLLYAWDGLFGNSI